MTAVRVSLGLMVNGHKVLAEVEPRLHLADFLREERLLTGTHLGCEHGVCGACTLLIDGSPARSCIALAATCTGCEVQSIEGLEEDEAIKALRLAFTAHHALQCGFCTPGMLITARDIVLNLSDADDDRIRLELAGNLCRCTGYNNIVRAIRSVLDQRLPLVRPTPSPLPIVAFASVEAVAEAAGAPSPDVRPADGERGQQAWRLSLRLGVPRALVWNALCDPRLLASCVPGARLTEVSWTGATGGRLSGDVLVALGPIRARFTGSGTVRYEPASFSGSIAGSGQDRASQTRLGAEVAFAAREQDANETRLDVTVAYSLRGPLAQFGRGPIVQAFAGEIAGQIGRNLEARLKGEATATARPALGGVGLALRVMWTWMKSGFGGR